MERIGGEASCASAIDLLQSGLATVNGVTERIGQTVTHVEEQVQKSCNEQAFLMSCYTKLQHISFYKRAVTTIRENIDKSQAEEAVKSPGGAATTGMWSPKVHAAFLVHELEERCETFALSELGVLKKDIIFVAKQKQWLIETCREQLGQVMQPDLNVHVFYQ